MNIPAIIQDKVVGTSEPLRTALNPEQQLLWADRLALTTYRRALLTAKKEISEKKIERDAQGDGYRYPDLATVLKLVTPILNKNDLDVSFRTLQADGQVSVTCVLFHVDGHSEETTLSAPPDNSAGKNPVQAIGSTVTYLSRYTLFPMLGLAAGKDDDGKGGPSNGAYISPEQVQEVECLIGVTKADLTRLLAYARAPSLQKIPASRYEDIRHLLRMKGVAK